MKFKQKKTKKKWWLPWVVIILITTTFVRSSFLVSKINSLLLPGKVAVYESSKGVKEFFNSFSKIREIYKKNQELELINEKQNYVIIENKNLLKENQELRKALDLKKKSEYEMIVAGISYIDALNPYDIITINKGSKDGIEKNSPVICEFGVVGRVKDVFEDYSIVELITSNKSYTSAVDKERKNLAILSGQGNETLSLEYIVVDSDIKVGEKIYTSGISDIYEENLYLGTITSVNDSDEMYKEVLVKLPYDIFNLRYVMVLKKEK
jgi:rod shape-determining protein MreC